MRSEFADALVNMWDAYDRSAPDAWGCKLQRHEPTTLCFVEALAVVMALSRIAETRLGVSVSE